MTEYRRFLSATDGTDLSARALDHGLALAKRCGAAVVAVNVVAHYPRSYFDGEAMLDMNEAKQSEARWVDSAKVLLDGVVRKGLAAEVDLSTELVRSDLIGESIIKVAVDKGCDLIIMATSGRKGLQRVLMGSETQYVVTHSHIPVLVVPKPAA